MAFRPSFANNNAQQTNNSRATVIGYANNYVEGLKGGRRKLGSIKMYENNDLHKFIKDNEVQLGEDGRLRLSIEVVFVENNELELEEEALSLDDELKAAVAQSA